MTQTANSPCDFVSSGFCPLSVCRLKFVEGVAETEGEGGSSAKRQNGSDEAKVIKSLEVEPHRIPNRGPYPYNQPRK